MGQTYKQYKVRHGWVTVQDDKWKCDCCKKNLMTKFLYDYLVGICQECRSDAPDHIPQEQIIKWLKHRKRALRVE